MLGRQYVKDIEPVLLPTTTDLRVWIEVAHRGGKYGCDGSLANSFSLGNCAFLPPTPTGRAKRLECLVPNPCHPSAGREIVELVSGDRYNMAIDEGRAFSRTGNAVLQGALPFHDRPARKVILG